MKEKIKEQIANLKHHPGVYLMHDINDKIIYVGKAKDLSNRVSQYFLRPQTGKVQAMVSRIEYFETILTSTEKEALILEMNLIQKYYPRYNILLKDDKHYPYIAIKKEGETQVIISRNKKDKNYDYFGPFPSSTKAYEMVTLLNNLFPLKKCSNTPIKSCLYYHLGKCLGPCINKINNEVYEKMQDEIKDFLKGNNLNIKNKIKEKMILASENLEFEKAQEYKDLLAAIEHINDVQHVELFDKVDRDIFAYSLRNGYLSLGVLIYRKGILLDKKTFIVESFDEVDSQVENLICQFYSALELPKEIIINDEKIKNRLSELLDAEIISISKGKLLDLVSITKNNADNALDEYFISSKFNEDKIKLIEELGSLLNIKTPYHIDLFDNSHLQGSSPVGGLVSFINGERAPKLYRKFKIEHEEARDDIQSMKEILFRHYSRSKKENKDYPDLILLDGGISQIKAAKEILDKLEINIPLFGLFKNDKHQTSGIVSLDGKEYKILNKDLFFLLTRMQDEVHRFAISFHKQKRNKKMTNSYLDEIKGLGFKRKELLYKTYPDINLLKEASINELMQILPQEVAFELYKKIHYSS